jgi:hypothetical protein
MFVRLLVRLLIVRFALQSLHQSVDLLFQLFQCTCLGVQRGFLRFQLGLQRLQLGLAARLQRGACTGWWSGASHGIAEAWRHSHH